MNRGLFSFSMAFPLRVAEYTRDRHSGVCFYALLILHITLLLQHCQRKFTHKHPSSASLSCHFCSSVEKTPPSRYNEKRI